MAPFYSWGIKVKRRNRTHLESINKCSICIASSANCSVWVWSQIPCPHTRNLYLGYASPSRTHTCCHVPAHSSCKKLWESRCGDIHESRVLIEQRRWGTVNETPRHHAATCLNDIRTHTRTDTLSVNGDGGRKCLIKAPCRRKLARRDTFVQAGKPEEERNGPNS